MSRAKIVARDPDAAAARLERHLDELWEDGAPHAREWRRFRLDPLRWIVTMPALGPDGRRSEFLVRLDGRRYDQWPPELQFVDPDGWEPATGGRWWPAADPQADPSRPPWFELHPTYDYGDGDPRPLVCFSLALGYYESDHGLGPDVHWVPGQHTVADTLGRVAQILAPPYFRGGAR